jgi:hypothetical protein
MSMVFEQTGLKYHASYASNLCSIAQLLPQMEMSKVEEFCTQCHGYCLADKHVYICG